jgi:chromosome segregation ATPase
MITTVDELLEQVRSLSAQLAEAQKDRDAWKESALHLAESRTQAERERDAAREALARIERDDQTGPTMYEEVKGYEGRTAHRAIGGSPGPFAKIARAALQGSRPDAE